MTKKETLKKLFSQKHIAQLNEEFLVLVIINAENMYKAKAWQRLTMTKHSVNKNYLKIILEGNEEYTEKAWESLLKNKPSNQDYLEIILKGNEHYAKKSWDLFLKRKISKKDLLQLISHDNPHYHEIAVDMLFATENLTNDDLVAIIENTFDKKRTKAISRLLDNKPSDTQLAIVIRYGDSAEAMVAWKELSNRKNVDFEVFLAIIQCSKNIFQMYAWNAVAKKISSRNLADILCFAKNKKILSTAWKKFTSQDYGYKDLGIILQSCEHSEYKNFLVKEELVRDKKHLSKQKLCIIIEYYNDYNIKSQAAELLFKLKPTNAELDIVIAHCNDEKDTVSRAKMFYRYTTESLIQAYKDYLTDEKNL